MADINPYRILGIRRDSGPKRIKKAFRDAAKGAHPDVGGSAEAFHLVRRAYFVLSDPERRAKYDRTGQIDEVSALSFQNQVAAALVSLFEQYVRSGKAFKRDLDVIEAMQSSVGQKIEENEKARVENDALIAPLVRLKSRISRREGDNLFSKVLDHRIAQLHEHSGRMDEQMSVLKAARAELESYDCVTEMVQHHRLFAFVDGTSATSTSTLGGFR